PSKTPCPQHYGRPSTSLGGKPEWKESSFFRRFASSATFLLNRERHVLRSDQQPVHEQLEARCQRQPELRCDLRKSTEVRESRPRRVVDREVVVGRQIA